MRLPALHACALVALLIATLACAPAAGAAQVMRLVDPVTDNYKASYGADPSVPENRTWLAIRSVAVAGTTWKPVEPAEIRIDGASLTVVGADGRAGTLTATIASGPFRTIIHRTDPTNVESGGRWGVLSTVTDRAELRTSPAVVRLALVVDGATIGVGTVSYRYDAALAGVAPGHIEYNGPGGRWYVGSTRTRTNEETAPAAISSVLAGTVRTVARPRIHRVRMPLRTRNRYIPLRVSGRNAGGVRITHIRVRIGSRGWSRWVRTRARYTLVLARGQRVQGVRIQLRDARGRTSTVARRRVVCRC